MRKLTVKDYDLAYQKLHEFCEFNKDIILFGRFGEVKSPSISDLDIFICIADLEYNNTRLSVLNFINQDDDLKYMCSHEPLIVPQKIIGITLELHTLYGLNLSVDKIGYNNSKRNNCEILNIVWATTLVTLGGGVTNNYSNYSDRFKLLLLKNIHQSLENLSHQKGWIERSYNVREKYLKGEVVSIDDEFHDAYNELIDCFIDVKLIKKLGLNNKNFNNCIVDRNIGLSFKYEGSVLGINILKVPPLLVQLFGFFYSDKSFSSNEELNKYKGHLYEAFNYCLKENIDFPFILPFSSRIMYESVNLRLLRGINAIVRRL